MTQGRPSADDIVIRPAPAGGPSGTATERADDRVVVETGGGRGAAQRPERLDQPVGAAPERPAQAADGGGAPAAGRRAEPPLLDDGVADDLLRRWSDVQARFVDDPRGAVLAADGLVAEVVRALAARFAQHRDGLEEQWSRGSEPSTEELRLALQQYRSLFQRLLAT